MTRRNYLLTAAKRASEVIHDFAVKQRIAEGYTRIDPAVIASEADVTVMYRPFDQLLGGFLREGGASGIIVNVARPRGLVHMTCAHELGHYFLGHESTTDKTVDHGAVALLVEQQANYFAYSLLAPQWLVVATMKRKGWKRTDLPDPSVVYQLSLRLGTSFTATVWSLVRLGFLSNDTAEHLAKHTPKHIKQEPLGGLDLVDPNADVWVLDASDRDQVLEPGCGDQFVVDLPNHAGAGYLWSIDELRSEGFVLKPFVRDARTISQPRHEDVLVGGSVATTRYALHSPESLRAGDQASDGNVPVCPKRHVISVCETTPWSLMRESNDTFSLGAEFDVIKDGFSQPERERRIAAARDIQ